MSVEIRDRGLRNTSADPKAPAQRARDLDTVAADPAATSGTPVRVRGGAVDGAERISSRNEDPQLRAILDNPPPLPSSGGHILGRSERAALDDFLDRTSDGDAVLMWQAITEMARTSQIDMNLAKRIRNAQQQGKLESKRDEMSTVEDQNSAERRSAGFNLAMSASAAAVSLAGYASGSGNLGVTLSQAANSLVSASGQYINKTAGPQREADELKIKGMRHQMMQQVFEQGIENAKQNYDQAKEGMKLALKILTEHAERQTQITTTITRI